MVVLRSYVYRDDERIAEFLEQIHDGQLSETTIERSGSKDRRGKLGLKGVAEADLGSASTSSESFTLAATPVSRASQLEQLIAPETSPMGPMDDEAFAQIRPGEIVRFEGSTVVPEIIRMAFVGAALGKLASVATAFGVELEGVEATLTQLDALLKVMELDGFPVVADDGYGGPGIMFVARPSRIIGEPLDLATNGAVVIGRVKKAVARGRTLSQPEILPTLSPHLPHRSRDQRRATGSSVKAVSLRGPALLVEPIMIYT